MHIERARYEAELAERRYESVDPGNRLIAAISRFGMSNGFALITSG